MSYRLYLLDGAGKISTADWIEASDDEAAVRQAQEQCAAGKHELWHGRRLVAEIAKKDS